MLEWLAASTGIELGKLVLEQVLDLGKPVLEGYVQDFFKGCLDSGIARLNASTLKTPMAEAVGYFVKRFVRELQINGVADTSIEHHYKTTIKRFVQDKAVGPILGKAFEKDCKQIDYGQLERIWTQHYKVAGWQFPAEEFDWRGVGKEYVYEVRGIIKANAELRSLLETDLLEDIARNTAQLSPGFDLETYRESLQSSYGYLKLYTLDSTDRVDAIKLWSMFIEQTVREALPPLRYELPSDLKRRLHDRGQLEDDLSPEALEHYRREYFQQPARKVLEAVADSQRAVILGDPGSGKSSLLQYLALEWVEGNTETLPLLIELREFAIDPANNFLEFLHRGRGVDWQFDQQQLHQHLLESPTLVMFDGLDEVFDRTIQSTVIDDIIRFSQQYPKAQVLVTSRIIGYNPERLRHSGFQHFTIQSLDTDEIHEFIDRWYDLSMGSDPDKARLKQRLKDAIANSQAIANLADNPLLLTMMAILNLRQELPRDRADLYDQASRVLLYQWDIEHKRLKLPMDAIGRREKQEMLRLIAYEMQAGEEGLKGNLISADRLIRVLTDYLRDEGFSAPREKADLLIQQLRERNFILCYRGADTYSFMHRTFLEYFCALEIKERFNKRGVSGGLIFEELRDEIFGNHWHEKTWHEVLRLVCGQIESTFSLDIVNFLLNQKVDKIQYLTSQQAYIDFMKRMEAEGFTNLLVAVDCFSEIKFSKTKLDIGKRIKEVLIREIEEPQYALSYEATESVLVRIAQNFESEEILEWLKKLPIRDSDGWALPKQAAVWVIGDYFHKYPGTLHWFQLQSLEKINPGDIAGPVRWSAVKLVAEYYSYEPETMTWLMQKAQQKTDGGFVRQAAIQSLAQYYKNVSQVFELLKQILQADHDRLARIESGKMLIKYFSDISEVFQLLCETVMNDPFQRKTNQQLNPRKVILEEMIKEYKQYPEVLELFRDRASRDADKQLREWAQEQLQQLENQGGSS